VQVLVFFLLATAGSTSRVWAQIASDLLAPPSTMTFPSLVFHPLKAKRIVRPDGMVLFLLEDHELPLIQMQAIIRTGSYLDPDDKLGLAEMTGAVMRTGGTEKMSGDRIDDELEFVAASVETYIGEEAGWASLSVLKKDLDRGLAIFGDVLMHPVFDSKKVELRRNQYIEQIRRRNDQPAPIAQREWKRLVYAGHPFGRISTARTIRAISRDDLVRFHGRCFFPGNIILSVSGDFEEADLVNRLNAVFGGWKKGEGTVPLPPPVPLKYSRSLNLIEKDGPQAVLRMGHLGVAKNDPDWPALDVFDSVLGGNGFSSRLMREVRSNRGLAYSVASLVSGGRSRGVILTACQTKSASCVEALSLMRDILKGFRNDKVSDEELKIAKESIANSFVFRFNSSFRIVSEQANLEYLGLPADWLEFYREGVSRVTADDVLRVARKHLQPDQLTIVVVGKHADFDKPLSSLGPVRTLPIEDFTK